MKRQSFFGAILLTVVYCLAVGFAINSPVHPRIQGSLNAGGDTYFSGFLTADNGPALPSKSTASNLQLLPSSNAKSAVDELWGIIKAAGQLLDIQFVQYTQISKTFLIKYRKANLLFPFHFFW